MITKLKIKSFPSHKGGADLRFNSHQPDTSRSCKSTDTGLVCHVRYLFTHYLISRNQIQKDSKLQCTLTTFERNNINRLTGNFLINHYNNMISNSYNNNDRIYQPTPSLASRILYVSYETVCSIFSCLDACSDASFCCCCFHESCFCW